MDFVIKNGTIVMATDSFKGDISVRDGKIWQISQSINEPAKEVIDAEGKFVLPGSIDAHTHFKLPMMGTVTADDFASGSMACAAGGITTFIDFATQAKNQNILDSINARRKEADSEVYIDYSLHAALTQFNEDTLKSIPKLIEIGIPSFKLYMVYASEGWMADDGSMLAVMEEARDHGGIVTIHAENSSILDRRTNDLCSEGKTEPRWHPVSRPHFVEIEAIRRAIFLTEITNSRLYIVHISTAEGTRLVGEAKGKGMMVFGETCPQFLLLSDDKYEGSDGHHYCACPPLRKRIDSEMLWRGLSVGAIQVVATDHCSFTKAQKDVAKNDFTKIPRGLPGVELLLPLIHSEGVRKKRISINQMVEILSTNPAKLFGLYPKKGSLVPGADADIVIFDPEKKKTVKAKDLHMNTDFSPYEDMEICGWPQTTISKGRKIFHDGKFTGEKGWGKFIPRFYSESDWEK